MADTKRTILCILWVLILLDSMGAIVFWSNGALSSWYSSVMPKLADVFPLQNGWPWMYLGLAILGGITVVLKFTDDSCESVQNQKDDSR